MNLQSLKAWLEFITSYFNHAWSWWFPCSPPSLNPVLFYNFKKAFTENIFCQIPTLQHPYSHCSTRLLPHKMHVTFTDRTKSPLYPNTNLYAHEPQALSLPAFRETRVDIPIKPQKWSSTLREAKAQPRAEDGPIIRCFGHDAEHALRTKYSIILNTQDKWRAVTKSVTFSFPRWRVNHLPVLHIYIQEGNLLRKSYRVLKKYGITCGWVSHKLP